MPQQIGKLAAAYASIRKKDAKIAELVAASEAALELVSIVTEERDFLLTLVDKNASLLNEIDELKAQLVAVKDGSGTGQSPCAKFCESVALRKDFDQLREHADKMKVERDELASQVEHLRKAVNENYMNSLIIYQAKRILRQSPKQHLAEIRAKAIENAATYLTEAIPDESHESVIFKDRYIYISNRYLREYAAKVRQGGVE